MFGGELSSQVKPSKSQVKPSESQVKPSESQVEPSKSQVAVFLSILAYTNNMSKDKNLANRVNVDLTGLTLATVLAKLLYITKILIYNYFSIVINFLLYFVATIRYK